MSILKESVSSKAFRLRVAFVIAAAAFLIALLGVRVYIGSDFV